MSIPRVALASSVIALTATAVYADPVITPIVVTALAGAAGVGLGVTTVTAAALAVATTAVAAGASYLLRQSVGGGAVASSAPVTAAPANSQRTIPIAQAIPPRRMAFGRCRTGGTLFFQDNENPFLYIGTILSDGPIEGVEAVYFGDVLVPVDGSGNAVSGSAYFNRLKIEYGLGAATQTVSAELLAGFPSIIDGNFRQQGVARAVAKLNWGADSTEHNALWGNSITPNYLGKWLKVYDPRDGAQSVSNPATWTYSSNPALCIVHALRNAWTVAIPHTSIDWPSVIAAANVCDQTLTYSGATVKLFELAGIFQAGQDYGAQIQEMLSSCGGAISYRGGLYKIRADAARASIWTVTDDDVISLGEFQYGTEKRAKFNTVSARYFDTNDGGVQRTTPAYSVSAAVAAEGERETSVSLPFTPYAHSAQILAYRELIRSRDGRALSAVLSDAALSLDPGDVITLALTEAASLNGLYEVVQVDLGDVGAMVTLKGYTAAAYADPATYLV